MNSTQANQKLQKLQNGALRTCTKGRRQKQRQPTCRMQNKHFSRGAKTSSQKIYRKMLYQQQQSNGAAIRKQTRQLHKPAETKNTTHDYRSTDDD